MSGFRCSDFSGDPGCLREVGVDRPQYGGDPGHRRRRCRIRLLVVASIKFDDGGQDLHAGVTARGRTRSLSRSRCDSVGYGADLEDEVGACLSVVRYRNTDLMMSTMTLCGSP